MRLRKFVVVGLVGFVAFAANIATAEDAAAPGASFVAIDGVSFADPMYAFGGERFEISIGEGASPRFAELSSTASRSGDGQEYRRYEVALVARAPAGLDVAFAQRGGLGFNDQGDIESQSRSSELRLGRGLRSLPRNTPSSTPTIYAFAASEDEALIWRPGMRSAFGGTGASLALQDRVEIGNLQAGVTYEVNGLQASLAYVEREVSVRAGGRTVSENQEFTGVTVTMRH